MNVATESKDAADLVGSSLPGGWNVVRHVGEGAMGHVYEAVRRTPERRERGAVKVLHTSLVSKPDLAFRFRREGEILSTISSPHVPKLFERGRDERGRPFFVIEFVEGVDLHRFSEEHRVTIQDAVTIVLSICRAIAAAHAVGVVHRDIKPENVMIRDDDTGFVIKVVDFGISKTEDVALTQAGMVMGTPAYMPPEQARGDVVTPLFDVYGAGAILYTLLTKRPPFEDFDPGKALAALLTSEPPTPRSLNALISRPLERVMMKAMARDPKERFASIDAFAAALTALGEPTSTIENPPTDDPDEGRPTLAHEPPTLPNPPVSRRSKVVRTIAIALLLGVLVAIGVFVLTGARAL